MMGLTREQFNALDDRKMEAVGLPEGLGTVYVRRWDGATRRKVEALLNDPKVENKAELVAVYSLCDDKGNPMFSESESGLLSGRAGTTLDAVCEAAYKLNVISKAAVEDIEKK